VGSASSLLAADFDGDGRAEVISAPPADSFQRRQLSFHYFDDRSALAETRLFPKLLASPVFTELSGDGRSDLVFTDFRVGILPGRSDRVWVPETFRSYFLPDTHVRVVAVYDDIVEQQSALLFLTTLGGVPGIYVPDVASGHLALHGELPGPVEELSGAVSGDVIEGADSPCREAILAQRGAGSFFVLDVCGRDAGTGVMVWRERATRATISLEPPATIEGEPQVADLDGDGHLDVLVAASGRPYASFGDGRRLGVATPYRLGGASSDGGGEPSLPLAVGDFTGDGAVDFVFADRLRASTPSPGGAAPTYADVHMNPGARWTVATIADVNGNGKPDVMAGSSAAPGIDFFNGTGTAHPIASKLQTPGSVRTLSAGDYDGDLTNDLAFIASGAKAREGDALMIAFGSAGGLLTPPVQVARVRGTEQLGTFREASIGNMIVVSYEPGSTSDIGALTFLNGSSDRLPFAPYGLTTVSPDGVLQGSNALALTVGAFAARGKREVLALATRGLDAPYDFWLGPTVEAPGTTPLLLEGTLDPRLEPWSVLSDRLEVHLAGASADLDRDGLDEALWVMPADAHRHCGLAITSANREAGGRLVLRGTIVLDEPCETPAVLPVDADGDGWLDVALLTSAEGPVERRLLVLWNDGAGALSADARSVVSREGESPRAFTALPGTAAEPFRFAYVTQNAAIVVDGSDAPRAFGSPRIVASLEDGTGIAAGDVNGDGVLDLAVADAGNVSVLLARLKAE
jgi:hypothetical protein